MVGMLSAKVYGRGLKGEKASRSEKTIHITVVIHSDFQTVDCNFLLFLMKSYSILHVYLDVSEIVLFVFT